MLYSSTCTSPLGTITLACDNNALVGLWLEGQKYFAATMDGEITDIPEHPVLTQTKKWLEAYFAGENPAISTLPLAPKGSEFRKAVWDILCEIPYGQCTTYGEISKQLAARMNRKSMSSQAVGGAVGHNPVSIIIPCHRVVGSDGSLTGYAGGISKKIQLLELEGVDLSRFYLPKKGTAL